MSDDLTQQQCGELIMLGERLGKHYGAIIEYYLQLYKAYPDDEEFSPEKAHARITQPPEQRLKDILGMPLSDIDWGDLNTLANSDHARAVEFWEQMKVAADDYVASGMMACETLESKGKPWNRAQFIAIRKRFIEDWGPHGAVEMAMVEMLAQAFISYHHWLRAANSMMARQYEAADEECLYDKWRLPYQSAADSIERAINMADKFNRLFMRTLRQMRDLRRYSVPVIINNPEQVNVATDGGQQVNVQKKGRAKGRTSRNGPAKLRRVLKAND
jgi:hypothetical protein